MRDGAVRELTGHTTYPLGILERERALPASTALLEPGDRLLLYSDGIVEAPLADGSRFGAERLQDILLEHATKPPALSVKAIERAVIDATADQIGDDATQVLLAIDG